MTFPRIECLDDLRQHVQHKPELRFREEDHNTTVVCYMISDEDTFSDEWARECRGITFCNETGKVIMRTLHKFFNLGERESTRKENLPWGNVFQIMDKRDGSMISAAFHKDELLVKSKKSFTSAVALQAKEYIKNSSNHHYFTFIVECTKNGWTPTFEWTTPKQRIVLDYGIDELVLLHIRDNVTGEYLDFRSDEVAVLINRCYIPTVDTKFITHSNTDIDSLQAYFKSAQDIEGCIIQFDNGDMVKIKTDWYIKLHRAVTFVRERDIALMVLEEEIDDVKGAMRDLNMDLEPVLAIEHRVKERFDGIVAAAEALAASKGDMDMKAFALANKEHPMFHLAVRIVTGGEPAYYDYFMRNVLKQEYGLEQVIDGRIAGIPTEEAA